ncbi:MAG TPA: hypothetical protein ENK02_05470 [Planctomycetes bacterium]|nr:hypothetical protein [Planctomycetota bacterium]
MTGSMEYEGTKKLAKSTAAYLGSLGFAIVWLLAISVGASWSTALLRGGMAFVLIYVLGRILLLPLIGTILHALTEAEKRRREAEE